VIFLFIIIFNNLIIFNDVFIKFFVYCILYFCNLSIIIFAFFIISAISCESGLIMCVVLCFITVNSCFRGL